MSIADLFDINNKFNQDMIEVIKENWSQEDIGDFTNSILITVNNIYYFFYI